MKYTKEEIQFIKDFYPENPKLCAEVLGRDYKALTVKAGKLGVKANRTKNLVDTHEKYAAELLPRGIIPIEQYLGSTHEILHECLKCGEHFLNKPINMLHHVNKNGMCPWCSKSGHMLTEEAIKARLPEGISLMEEYNGMMRKHLFRQESCGHEWSTKPHDIIFNSTRCPKCTKSGPTRANKVYLAFFPELNLYKIGTSSDPTRRAQTFGYKCDIVWVEEYPSYLEAQAREQELLNKLKLTNTGLLKSGNTETFYENNNTIQLK